MTDAMSTPDREERINELFGSAVKLDMPERTAFLDGACGDDASIRSGVEQMLASWSEVKETKFLEPAAVASAPALPRGLPPRRVVESLLRERMLPGALLSFCAFGGFFIKNMLDGTYTDPSRAEGSDRLFLVIAHVSAVVICAACTLILWLRRRQRSVAALRRVEIAIVVASVLFVVQYQRSKFHETLQVSHEQPDDPRMFDPLDATNDSCTLRWFLLIIAYGVYVPNSLLRWGFMMAALAGTSLATTYVVDAPDLARSDRLMETAIWLGVAVALSAIGPAAVNRLKKERVEARRFGLFRLIRRVGQGNMGTVFLAEHWLHQGHYAVKLIAPELAENPEYSRRFKHEVETIARVRHENIVQVFDSGRTNDDILYYVMDYLHGLSLKEMVEISGPMPPGRVVYILEQVCSALAEAHGKNVIHRDIKPNNVFVCERDVVKVLDFGIALPTNPAWSGQSSAISDTAGFKDVSGFMSPEQAAGHDPVPAHDIYSLGATAYYMLTGHIPYADLPIFATISANMSMPRLMPIEQLRHDIPVDLGSVVMKCLARDQAERFQSVQELERALAQCQCASAWDKRSAISWWKDRLPAIE